ncbi:uncharacterized protein LOC142348534 [Convolutriloba macropyga]|uniref:uncharacterized protein LOC142348534 n=1 Tax=Convolutriloba macropyga TaxID=536237 RepID=UPI003F5260DD
MEFWTSSQKTAGTDNNLYVKFYYIEADFPGVKIQLNNYSRGSALDNFNQRFRPNQENVFQVLVPDFAFVNLNKVWLGFYDDPQAKCSALDDDLVLRRLTIRDGKTEHLFISESFYHRSYRVETITKDKPTLELRRVDHRRKKELKDDEVNNGNSLWFKSKEVAVLIHLRVPVAEVAIPAFQSGL